MRSIKVLGSGCSRCATTARLIEQVAAERGVPIDLEKVSDVERIVGYGVMSTPAVVVDGKVAIAGGVPDRAMVEQWLVPQVRRSCCGS